MTTLNELVESYRPKFSDAKVSDIRVYPCYAEAKFDGEFIAIFIYNKKVIFANRHKSQYSPTSYILPYLPKINSVLLAEYISLKGDLYHYLSDRVVSNCKTLALRVHGIVYLGNEDCRNLDYETRYKLLRQLIPIDNEYVSIINYRKLTSQQDVREYFNECLKNGREGIVIKTLGSLHDSCEKIKKRVTLDVAVLGIKKSKKWIEKRTPNSFVLGTLENGRWKRCGESSSGLTDLERKKVGEIILRDKIGEDKHYIYCRPTIILEITCQEVMGSGFRHPRIIKIRHDKTITMVTPINKL